MTPYDKLVAHLCDRHDVRVSPAVFDEAVLVHRVLHDAEMSDHDYQRVPETPK